MDRVAALDLSLFDAIPSETSFGDRRSLLAVQRAVTGRHGQYVYLEIGSHLGGSIQPHLVDRRCARIYSIDPRPLHQPDDRAPGCTFTYENNSTRRMLDLLTAVQADQLGKIKCFDCDAAKVDPRQLTDRPHLAFIDGEHTRSAALSDFRACRRLMREDGVVLFHDASIVYPALVRICRDLRRERRRFAATRLDGDIFAIFFDPGLLESDSYLAEQRARHRRWMWGHGLARLARRVLPACFPVREYRRIRLLPLFRLRRLRRTLWQLATLVACGPARVQLAQGLIANGQCLQRKWELAALMVLVKRLRPAVVVEIGTCRGGTLACWSSVCPPTTRFVSIDLPGGSFGGGYTEADAAAFRRWLKPGQTLQCLRADSHDPATREELRRVLGSQRIDFLFIDGDHSYQGVKADYEMYHPLVRPGGLVGLHDIVPHPFAPDCRVDQFWTELKGGARAKELVDHDGLETWGGIGVVRV